MNTSIPKELIEAFEKIVKSGDEAKARAFLVENLKQFPQETQDTIIAAFVQEALEKKNQDAALLAEFQKGLVENAKNLENMTEEMERLEKLAEIKESL